jgi:polar amino acid transport system substrate-binding protein
MRIRHLFFILPLLIFCCCGKSKGKEWQIALDPTWYPLDLMGRDKQVVGFATDLLQEVASRKKMEIVKVRENWDNLISGLQKEKYDAILSSIEPYLFYEKQYDFSKAFVQTGPVLIVPYSSKAHSLGQLDGKEVAMIEGAFSDELILEKYPDIIIRKYSTIPNIFNDMLLGVIDAAIIDVLEAVAYTEDLYQGQVKVVGEPLDETGLRLITLHEKAHELIKAFDETLQELKASGKYAELAKKWNLPTVRS